MTTCKVWITGILLHILASVSMLTRIKWQRHVGLSSLLQHMDSLLLSNACLVQSLLSQPDCQFHMFEVRVDRQEVDLADTLSKVQGDIEPAVQLGSYPQFEDDR